jgi:hypothetical protein
MKQKIPDLGTFYIAKTLVDFPENQSEAGSDAGAS